VRSKLAQHTLFLINTPMRQNFSHLRWLDKNGSLPNSSYLVALPTSRLARCCVCDMATMELVFHFH
jgi:hypothetical protein